ncbi:Phytochrome-like protein cph1 [Planctomycetes bacterium Poly30]|uniref:histidine kinase n=1 Tax=Saltatorellus ferox TaxID=2528018 RepID=A0A518EXK1_9BACT|nr:Phytochrome-like protein cph1 [Planctomycetes bacterium Poly30]
MSLAQLKLAALNDQFQIVVIMPDGEITASCDSLVDLSSLVGSNAFECISAFMGLEPALAALDDRQPELLLPTLCTPEFGTEVSYDVRFRYQCEGSPLLLLLSKSSATDPGVRSLQQQRNESAIALDHTRDQNKSLRSYAHVVTHDLKGPLRAVKHLVQWIDESIEQGDRDRTSDYLALLRERAESMEALIEGILGYSLDGDERASATSVDTLMLVRDIIRRETTDRQVTATVDERLPVIQGVPSAVQQVFSNLISNAIHHGRPIGGSLSVDVEHEEDFYRFSISDNGPGIDPRHFDGIFGTFTSLPAATGQAGRGLGLSIARSAVEAAGGTIAVESEPGHGATFIVRWPRVGAADDGHDPRHAAPPPMTTPT